MFFRQTSIQCLHSLLFKFWSHQAASATGIPLRPVASISIDKERRVKSVRYIRKLQEKIDKEEDFQGWNKKLRIIFHAAPEWAGKWHSLMRMSTPESRMGWAWKRSDSTTHNCQKFCQDLVIDTHTFKTIFPRARITDIEEDSIPRCLLSFASKSFGSLYDNSIHHTMPSATYLAEFIQVGISLTTS